MSTYRPFARAICSGYRDSESEDLEISQRDVSRMPTEAPFNLAWWNFTDYPDRPWEDPEREVVRVVEILEPYRFRIERGQMGTTPSRKNRLGRFYSVEVLPPSREDDRLVMEEGRSLKMRARGDGEEVARFESKNGIWALKIEAGGGFVIEEVDGDGRFEIQSRKNGGGP